MRGTPVVFGIGVVFGGFWRFLVASWEPGVRSQESGEVGAFSSGEGII